jgi:hypothetical protein
VPPAPPAFKVILDFPGYATGNKLLVERGSKVNGISISGEARVDSLTPNSAKLWVRGGAFGIRREAIVEIVQTGPAQATLTATEPGKPPVTTNAAIIAARTGYLELRDANGGAAHATLALDPTGKLIVDFSDGAAEGLTAHLILSKAPGALA